MLSSLETGNKLVFKILMMDLLVNKPLSFQLRNVSKKIIAFLVLLYFVLLHNTYAKFLLDRILVGIWPVVEIIGFINT